jgi:hypothetical protein
MVQIIRLDPVTLQALDPTNAENTALFGAVNETAPASDTADSGLNGRLQRIAQRITALIALLPAALGQTTKAASLSVALASDDASLTLLGAVAETAPTTDTASSGLNGRLQRIAQRLTDLVSRTDNTYRLLASLNTTNSALIKNAAGVVWKVTGNNTVAAKKYIKLYNKATAPTVGTDVPVVTLVIPASSYFNIDIPGRAFATGIGVGITGAAADNDTTAVGAGDIECLNIFYK